MSQGWIKLSRSFIHDELWLSEKFTKAQAWVDMIALANHKPGHIICNGLKIELQRGQLGWSEVRLSERWQWSRGKVRRFFSELENVGNIVQQKDKRKSITTIVNYDLLQGVDTTHESETVQQTVQQKDNRQYTNKNEKNEKKVIKDICLKTKEVFDHWVMRMGKTKAAKLTTGRSKAIKARMAEGYTVEDLKRAVDGCAKSKHHMGMNDQGTVYDDLTLICRSGEKVEQFMNNVSKVVPINPQGRCHEESQRDYLQTKPGYMLSPDEKRRKLEQQLEALQQSGIEDYF